MFIKLFQGVMKLGMYVIPWGMPEVIEGAGCIRTLPSVIQKDGFSKVLIVADDFLYKILVP